MTYDPNTNREAEMAVLSASLMSPVARKRIMATVTSEDFADGTLATIWKVFRELDARKTPIDRVTVGDLLKNNAYALGMLPDLVTMGVIPSQAEHYASIVHGLAVKRKILAEAIQVIQDLESPDHDPHGYAADVATRFANIRDTGSAETINALTLRELLDEEEAPYDWLIPQMLERGDRFMLTGEEGLGKSVFFRQIALCAAAGINPFGEGRIEPAKVLIVDAENSKRQLKRGLRALATQVATRGSVDPRDRVMIDTPGRIDITKDRELNRIHQMLDAQQPDLLIIGPLYRLTPKAIQTDDEAAPVLTALDTIKDRGIALLIEAHAGHAHKFGGGRDMRPRGSSALLGWPEFGYGLKHDPDNEGGYMLEKWRGDRDERNWPEQLKRGGALPWSAVKSYGQAWVA